MLQAVKNHLRHSRLHCIFRDLLRRFRNLPWLPTLLFSNSYSQEILSSFQLKCACGAASGKKLLVKTAPVAPQHAHSCSGTGLVPASLLELWSLDLQAEKSQPEEREAGVGVGR